MKLIDFINRPATPAPWSEGDNIPWNEPGFSERMLKWHLSQDSDAASRRFDKIDRQVAWIHQHVLAGQPARILDLGCGPGLYASRLAKLGHACTGIDFSPASIAYATAQAEQHKLACRYTCQDLRLADFGAGYDMAMLIFGEFNVFKPADARLILRKARAALAPGGQLLLEPHTFAAIEKLGREVPSWYTSSSGLNSVQPHISLDENSWDAGSRAATTRHFVIDAATAEVTCYAASYQAYTDADYTAVLNECGFDRVQFYPSLFGVPGDPEYGLIAITASGQEHLA
jgi:SAM-dependent methyltransferase